MKIAVVYHMFPHYRFAVMQALDSSLKNNYTFVGDDKAFEGIKSVSTSDFKDFRVGRYCIFKGVWWQPIAIKVAMSHEFDTVILLANPNFLSTWVAALLARLTGKRVLFWTHGWLNRERLLKRIFRHIFYKLAHVVMVYGERSKKIGVESGFPSNKIAVVYNSLDTDKAAGVVARIESGELANVNPRLFFMEPNRPLLICTARLTTLCRFDLLLDAAHELVGRGQPVNIILVGDGPVKADLEKKAQDLKLNVHFYGSCYDESTLGQLIYHADLTVSPGKIGLTAMHSLMYGTPAITHNEFDFQMPEVESIIKGKTGDFFQRDSVSDLAVKIESWLKESGSREKIRKNCWAVISDKWNPYTQVKLIESVIEEK